MLRKSIKEIKRGRAMSCREGAAPCITKKSRGPGSLRGVGVMVRVRGKGGGGVGRGSQKKRGISPSARCRQALSGRIVSISFVTRETEPMGVGTKEIWGWKIGDVAPEEVPSSSGMKNMTDL